MNGLDLIQEHLDGALSDAQAAELAEALRTDPAARAAFAAALRQDVLLGEVLAEAPATARPRRRLLVVAAAAAVLLLGAAVLLLRPRPPARLESARGEVRFDGASLETPSGAAATLILRDGTRLHAGSETALAIEPGRIVLRRGTLAADVAPQDPSRALVFATPQAEARVLGTRLVLSVDVDATLCKVEEGLVRLSSRDRSVDVRAGHYAVAALQTELKEEPVSTSAPVAGKPSVRIVAPSRWPKSYAAYPFRKGSLLYGDRGWRITDLPPEVDGALGIATLAEDRRSEEAALLVFELDREADVWVGIDGRAAQISKNLPAWLAGWESTGLKLHSRTAGNSYYHLFRRRYPAGSVTLGGNHHGGDTGAGVNYTVLVTAPAK